MKKIAAVLIFIFVVQFSFAKKVKFSVDMTGQVLSPSGIHVMSDFQALAGLGADFTPDGAQLTKDLIDTNIYYLYVDIPAFAKYEFKFVNGNFSYEVEVVEEKAQVGHNFNDNRWIYIDSLANDTTILPAFLFNKTSAAGYTMMRYVVDMTLQTVSPDGVHVAGDFQGWNAATSRLYSFGNSTYEIILYDTLGNTNNYNFYNGNAMSDVELVSGACVINSMRNLTLNSDTILAKVCFATCSTCYPASVNDHASLGERKIYPNPTSDYTMIDFNDNSGLHQVLISDLSGRTIIRYHDIEGNTLKIDGATLNQGVYLVSILNDAGVRSSHKLSVE